MWVRPFRIRRSFRLIAKTIAYLALGIFCVFALLSVVLSLSNVPPIRRSIIDLLQGYFFDKGITLKVSDIKGFIPVNFTIADLEYSDDRRQLLLKDVEIAIWPSIIKRSLVVKNATCTEIKIVITTETRQPESIYDLNKIQKLIFLVMDTISINNFTIYNMAIYTKEQVYVSGYSIKGSFVKQKDFVVMVDLTQVGGRDKIKINSTFNKTFIEQIYADVLIQRDGPLAKLVGIRDDLFLSIKPSNILREKYDFLLEAKETLKAKGAIYTQLTRKDVAALTDGFFLYSTIWFHKDLFKDLKTPNCFDIELFAYFDSLNKFKIVSNIISINSLALLEIEDLFSDKGAVISYEARLFEGINTADFSLKSPVISKGTVWMGNERLEGELSSEQIEIGEFSISKPTATIEIEKLNPSSYKAKVKSFSGATGKLKHMNLFENVAISSDLILEENKIQINDLQIVSSDFISGIKGSIKINPLDISLYSITHIIKNYNIKNFISFDHPRLAIDFNAKRLDNISFEISSYIHGLKENIVTGDEDASIQEVSFMIKGSYFNNELLCIRSANLKTGIMSMNFSGNFDLRRSQLDINGNVNLNKRPFLVSPTWKIDGLEVAFSFKGPIDRMDITSHLRSKGSCEGYPYEVSEASARLNRDGNQTKGSFQANGSFGGLSFKAHGGISFKDLDLWEVSFNAFLGQNTVLGSVRKEKHYEGKAEFILNDLEGLHPLTKVSMKGTGKLEIEILPQEKLDNVDFTLSAVDFKFNSLGISNLIGKGSFSINSKTLTSGSFSGKNIFLGSVSFGNGDCIINRESNQYYIDFKAKGGQDVKLMDVSLWHMTNGEITHLKIKNFSTLLDSTNIYIPSSTEIIIGKNFCTTKNLTLNVGDGNFVFVGSLDKDSLEADVLFSDILLDPLGKIFGIGILGKAGGHINIKGNVNNPEINAQFRLSNLRLADIHDPSPYNIDSTLTLKDARLNGECLLYQGKSSTLRAKGYLPVKLSLIPFHLAFEQQDAFWMEVRADARIGEMGIVDLFPSKGIDGGLILNVQLEKQNKSLALSGSMEVKDFEFTDVKNGIYLKNGSMLLKFIDNKIQIREFYVGDISNGIISGNGTISFNEFFKPEIHIPFKISHFKFLSREELDLEISGLGVIEGEYKDSVFKADLTIDKLLFDIEKIRLTGERELPIIEIRDPSETRSSKSPKPPVFWGSMRIDVNASAYKTVRMKSKDLDTLWKGSLRVRGSLADPKLSGTMDLERGRYNLFGKNFQFTSGRLVFQEEGGLKPYVSARAQAGPEGQRAIAELSGPIDKLELHFFSDAGLPPGEAFSRALFGKDMSRLSPIQGLKLMEMMSGESGRVPFLNLATLPERLFGLDIWDIGEGQDSMMGLRAGKYLGDRVYLELDWGPNQQQGRANVTMEITPNIELRTSIGEKGAGAEINFRWDY